MYNVHVGKVPTHSLFAKCAGTGVGTSQAIVGAVLGAKAATQLLVTPAAATLTACRGPATALRLATALLAIAALGLFFFKPVFLHMYLP